MTDAELRRELKENVNDLIIQFGLDNTDNIDDKVVE